MAKRTTTLPLTLPPREAGVSNHLWLCTALRAEILEGRLSPGARLPATRDLAAQYGLSRGTIVNAFEQLKSEGYLSGGVGSGTYVSLAFPEEWLKKSKRSDPMPLEPAAPVRRIADFGRRVRLLPAHQPGPSRAFRSDQPALDLFPTTLWAQVASRRMRRAPVSLLLACDPMGYRPLQEAVADYLRTSRGVKCAPEQVAIVSGAQEALDLVARLFLDPGDRVAMENPGYPGMFGSFEAARAEIAAVRLDGEGLIVHGSPGLVGARMVYVTPAHQFPSGVAMSLARRLELLEWARKTGALIVEDDYDSEFRYSGRPIPAMQGLDRHGVVLFVGSFSKVLFPSLRLGYLVVPPDLVDLFAAAKSVTSRHPAVLEQAVLNDFITEGHFVRHIRRMREIYAERLSVLLEEARKKLAGLLEVSDVEAGLQTAGWLLNGLDDETAERAAAARNVEVNPLSRYFQRDPGAEREGLQLGFAAVDPREIRRGMTDLAAALEGAGQEKQRGAP